MPQVGEIVTCYETGKQFTVQRDGCTFNYAIDSAGHVFSDDGVDMRERRELLDRTKPFVGYLSSDGQRFTGWKGNVLGSVIWSKRRKLARRSAMHSDHMLSVRVRDVHGGLWYGMGSPGLLIRLRPMKGK